MAGVKILKLFNWVVITLISDATKKRFHRPESQDL